ncbi:MAG: encapsulin, partial [Steroidobacteraceae bacterium]
MNELLREHAPISAAAWEEIDAEAKRTLKTLLAARRLVDFNGPLGWQAVVIPTGRTEKLSAALQDGVVSRLRRSLPLVEIRVPFE